MTVIAPTADLYLTATDEDRCAPRARVDIIATLRASGAQRFVVRVKDLSIAGFACEAVTGMKSGALCWLTLPGLSALQAEVVWNDGATVGCAFASLLNPAVHQAIVSHQR
jgi:hypothetical protein